MPCANLQPVEGLGQASGWCRWNQHSTVFRLSEDSSLRLPRLNDGHGFSQEKSRNLTAPPDTSKYKYIYIFILIVA